MSVYEAYREVMEATASYRRPPPPQLMPERRRSPVRAIVRLYGCYEYLHRIGLLNEGTLVYYEDKPRIPTLEEIQREVAAHFQIPVLEMTSARRSRDVARPRQVAMYLAKQLTTKSLPEIGRRFGDRDHTTVIHAINQIEKLRAGDAELDQSVEVLKDQLSTPCVGRRG